MSFQFYSWSKFKCLVSFFIETMYVKGDVTTARLFGNVSTRLALLEPLTRLEARRESFKTNESLPGHMLGNEVIKTHICICGYSCAGHLFCRQSHLCPRSNGFLQYQ